MGAYLGYVWVGIVGAIIGVLAAKMTKKGSIGILSNIIVGVVGAEAGSYLLAKFGFLLVNATIGSLVNGAIGAIVLLAVLKLIKK